MKEVRLAHDLHYQGEQKHSKTSIDFIVRRSASCALNLDSASPVAGLKECRKTIYSHHNISNSMYMIVVFADGLWLLHLAKCLVKAYLEMRERGVVVHYEERVILLYL